MNRMTQKLYRKRSPEASASKTKRPFDQQPRARLLDRVPGWGKRGDLSLNEATIIYKIQCQNVKGFVNFQVYASVSKMANLKLFGYFQIQIRYGIFLWILKNTLAPVNDDNYTNEDKYDKTSVILILGKGGISKKN